MIGEQDRALSVDAAAAAVDGVARVYSAAPIVVGLVQAALPAEAALSVVRGGEPVSVEVSIGVDADRESAEVARRVADAVRDVAGATSVVHVRVSRVHSGR